MKRYTIALIISILLSGCFANLADAHTGVSKLVNPKATRETIALYSFLTDYFGKKTLSGVMTIRSLNETSGDHQNEIFWLEERTGKRPVILGLD